MIFCRFVCDVCGKACNFALCDLKMQRFSAIAMSWDAKIRLACRTPLSHVDVRCRPCPVKKNGISNRLWTKVLGGYIERKLSQELSGTPTCICVKMEPFCPFVFFSLVLWSFLLQNWTFSTIKRSVLGVLKGPFLVSTKGQTVNLVCKTPKSPKCLQSKVEPNKITIGLITEIYHMGPKLLHYLAGFKKALRGVFCRST